MANKQYDAKVKLFENHKDAENNENGTWYKNKKQENKFKHLSRGPHLGLTFLDRVLPVTVWVVRQVAHQGVMGVGVSGTQTLHLCGCIWASSPGQFPWDEQEYHKKFSISGRVSAGRFLSFRKIAVRVREC
jgi:hypothetical protein